MKPSEVRAEITRIKGSMKLENILIEAREKRMNDEVFDSRIAEQEEIIAEAEEMMAIIQNQRHNAPDEIAKIKQHMQWEKKRLAVLENFEKIERLKSIVQKLSTISKEMTNGKAHSNTQAQGHDRNS